MTISVLLVDDHELIRQGLRRSFERDGDFEVIGEAGSAADAERLLRITHPDVVVLDVRLPDGSGLKLAASSRERYPELGIVILTMYAGDEQLFAALEAGASAFVPKNAPPTTWSPPPGMLRPPPVVHRQRPRRRDEAQAQPDRPTVEPPGTRGAATTCRRTGVAQISRRLFISESTTKTHISKLYEKLGAGNRAQALATALKLGLLRQSDPTV